MHLFLSIKAHQTILYSSHKPWPPTVNYLSSSSSSLLLPLIKPNQRFSITHFFLMDFHQALVSFSLCFLFFFPDFSHSAVHFSGWFGGKKMYLRIYYIFFLSLFHTCIYEYIDHLWFCSNIFWFVRQSGSVLKLTTGVSSATFDPTRVTQLSWRPRSILLIYLPNVSVYMYFVFSGVFFYLMV